ncbi:ParA family protein [Fusobacterium varium]|uniref:ParA family protein n=1 Tax=uncultured Fusobacterium sp. TaxID=159267 RepID=UPI0025D3C876|nr:ParA family protein [uncultured Fusobacterium sp.]MCF2640704.1 ParA family protein [Fusobacterium varium]
MKKRIGIFYKKENPNVISSAVLNVDREMIEILGISIKENDIKFSFKDNKITIQKGSFENPIKSKDKNIIEKNIKLNFTKVYKDKDYLITRLNIPSAVIKAMNLTSEDNEVEVIEVDDKIVIERSKKEMGKVFSIKVNKGGIGKTFLTVQLGYGLAMQNKKVLLLTSDSQNNILDYTLSDDEVDKIDFKKDLRYCVMNDKVETVKLRTNLYFIPTKSSLFTDRFLEKLPEFIKKMQEEYDYILIDSIPTMKIDSTFVACSDKVIIPMFCDNPTLKGAINVIKETGVEKIHSIIVNKYRPTATQKGILKDIKEAIEGTDIVFPEPIKELSQVETLARKGKTIWESRAKILAAAQESLLDVILKL